MTIRTLTAAALLLSLPSMSQALTLDCQITPNAGTGGYVTERYVFQQDADSAIVSDALILHFNDNQPQSAKVSEDTTKKLVLTWKVAVTNATGQITKMQFRAAYFKADGTITVRAVPSGYSNSFEGRGRCKSV